MADSFDLPRKIIIGPGAISQISDACAECGLSGRPLIISDPITSRIAGEKVARNMVSWMPRVEIGVSLDQKLADEIANRHKPSFVIGVGGGKVIDVGKLVAFSRKVPFISVPTAPSHDGIASATVTLFEGGKWTSINTKTPFAIIADISILAQAPSNLISAGFGDAVSKYTSLWDWQQAVKKKGESYSPFAAMLVNFCFERILPFAEEVRKRKEAGIRALVEALIASGMAMSVFGSSRPASGAEHAFSHALDTMGSKALHGEQAGIGTIIAAHLHGQDWRMVKRLLKDAGAPTTAKEAGLSEEMVIEALVKAKDVRSRWTILNEKSLDKKRALEVCKTVGVL